MFALLALAGDLGCSGGPTFAGLISSRFGNDLHKGILAAIIFPVLLLIGMMLHRRTVSPAYGGIRYVFREKTGGFFLKMS